MVKIIIVTYNGMKWIDKCLGSLQNQSIDTNIIVIDNGSTDGTSKYIQKDFPKVHLIINEKNHGFGHSNNQGMKIAIEEGTDYVFLLNQDAWVEGDTIARLVEIHQKYPKYGVLSPIHLRGDGSAVDMKYGMFVMHSENHQLFSDLYLHRNTMEEVYAVPFVNAAAWLISRECLEIVGGFSPVFYHYGEDMGYANRVLFHGLKTGICPSAVIYHDRINKVELPDMGNPEKYLTIKKNLYLIYLTDINHSFSERYLKLLFKLTVKICKLLIRLQLSKVRIGLREFGILLNILPRVLKNNSVIKKRNGAYLLNVNSGASNHVHPPSKSIMT